MSMYLGETWRRRALPRVTVESLCSEYLGSHERHALVVDLSEEGLRVQRPLGGPRTRLVQLEFEVPEVDEIVWASGEICFDQVWRVSPEHPGSLSGLIRTSGIRLVAAADRHRRLLREYVNDTCRQQREEETEWWYRSSCYLRG
jgi:hypothetical protein